MALSACHFRISREMASNKLLVNQQVDASAFATGYKVSDSSEQQGTS